MRIPNHTACYGCGVCEMVCPQKIISMQLNNEGFYIPVITAEEKCTQCGLCLSVCAYADDTLPNPPVVKAGYAAWSLDKSIRYDCSSGGVGFTMAAHLIRNGYRACGVRYNASEQRAEHFVADTTETFRPSIGSKYIPSYTPAGFSQLNRKDKFFVTGTPCQIDSLRRYIRKMRIEEHFVLMDFFCHGVPSMNLWKKYTEEVKEYTGKISDVSWRNKQQGWQDSKVVSVTPTTDTTGPSALYSSSLSEGDLFYKFFLGNVCLGRACYDKCKYKMEQSAADIRIGDLWGSAYAKNQEGVSALLVLTDRGMQIAEELQICCHLEPQTLKIVTEGQMHKSPAQPFIYKQISHLLRSAVPLRRIAPVISAYRTLILPKRVLNYLKRHLK